MMISKKLLRDLHDFVEERDSLLATLMAAESVLHGESLYDFRGYPFGELMATRRACEFEREIGLEDTDGDLEVVRSYYKEVVERTERIVQDIKDFYQKALQEGNWKELWDREMEDMDDNMRELVGWKYILDYLQGEPVSEYILEFLGIEDYLSAMEVLIENIREEMENGK